MSANGAMTARLVLASLLLFVLRSSESFIVPRRTGVASGGGGDHNPFCASTLVTGKRTGVPVAATTEVGIEALHASATSTGRDTRRERMATLSKVHWHPVQSGHRITAAEQAGAVAGGKDGFLGSALLLSGSRSEEDSWSGGRVRMGIGRGIGKGFGTVRRAVARVFGGGGGRKVRYCCTN